MKRRTLTLLALFAPAILAAAGRNRGVSGAGATTVGTNSRQTGTTEQVDFQEEAVPVVVASAQQGPVTILDHRFGQS